MPALPILYWTILKISKSYFFFICVKNIIIFTIYFFLSYYLSKNFKKKTFYLLLLVPIIIPYNFNVSLNYVYEDNLISIFLPLLFLSLININNNKIFIISLITFILFFTKTTMFLIVAIIPLIILLIEKKIILNTPIKNTTLEDKKKQIKNFDQCLDKFYSFAKNHNWINQSTANYDFWNDRNIC